MKKRVLIFSIVAAVLVGLGATAGQLAWDKLRLNDADASNYIELRPASTISSSFSLTLPSADGSAYQPLVTDGAGTLSFSSTIAAPTVTGDITLENSEVIANGTDGTIDFTAGVLKHAYDSAAYWTATQADGGAVTLDSVSDGTPSFTISDPLILSSTLDAGGGDITLENDETISNSSDGVVEVTSAGTLRNTYDAAAYADFTMADAGGLTVDVTSDGTASVDFADPVYMSGGTGTVKIFTHQDDSIADDGTVSLPDATDGVLIVSCGAESAHAVVQADGSVADVSSTTNVDYADTDANLAIFDGGTSVTVKNRLGGARAIRIFYIYN
jgi:hypothetical protein